MAKSASRFGNFVIGLVLVVIGIYLLFPLIQKFLPYAAGIFLILLGLFIMNRKSHSFIKMKGM